MSLEASGVTKRFGGVVAVNAVDLTVAREQVFGLIGPNGAGKTTLINVISGQLRPDGGTIRFEGADVTGLEAHELARRGVARTFQGGRVFKGLTALENVLVGGHTRMRSDLLAALVPFRTRAESADVDRSLALLDHVGLRGRARALAGELPYGDQRRLEIARALASHPRLLILDEPAAGLNPTESARLQSLMRHLVKDGLTIILIEHDVRLVMGTCQRVAVLNFGKKIAEGTPAEIQASAVVREAYLGSEDAA
jgi:ABC-type branched-subunit amino acid transport system ATPase component